MSKNQAYWSNRHQQWLDNQDKTDSKMVDKLSKEYAKTSKELEKEIASYFAQYGKDDVIEYRKLLQSLSDSDKRLLMQSMDTFAEKYPQYAHLMPVRESVYKLNRLQGLHYSSQLKLLELGAIEQEMMEQHLINTYGNNYEPLMKELGLGQSFVAINDEIIKQTINSKWVNDENFSERIWQNKSKMVNYIQSEFRDGVARGDNYNKLSQAISKRFDVGMSDAKRLVWTESAFVLNQAHKNAYIDAGVETYTISAIRDSKTSRICRTLDGETFRFDEMEVGVNFPPFHTYCRTTFFGNLDTIRNNNEPSITNQPNEPTTRYNSTKEAFESVRYSGIEKELAKEIDDRLLDLVNTYPIDTDKLKIRSLKIDMGTVGYHRYGFGGSKGVATFTNEIVFSNRYFADTSTIDGARERIAKSRKALNSNPSRLATIDHEYAHAIDSAFVIRQEGLRPMIDKWNGSRFRTRADVDEINTINKTISTSNKRLSHQLKGKIKEEYNINSDKEFFELVNTELGNYAAKNEAEFLAEGFSAYRHIPHSEQTEFLQKFGKHFESLFKEVF